MKGFVTVTPTSNLQKKQSIKFESVLFVEDGQIALINGIGLKIIESREQILEQVDVQKKETESHFLSLTIFGDNKPLLVDPNEIRVVDNFEGTTRIKLKSGESYLVPESVTYIKSKLNIV